MVSLIRQSSRKQHGTENNRSWLSTCSQVIRPWLLKIQHGKPCHTFAKLDVNILLLPHFCHVCRTLVGGRWPGRWSVFYLVGGLWSVFHLVGGEFLVWSVVGGEFLVWSVVDGFCGRWFLWSVRAVVGGRLVMWLVVGVLHLYWSVVSFIFENGQLSMS